MVMDYLRQMSALIAGGIVAGHGLDPGTVAERAIGIALEIDKRVSEIERSAPPPDGPPIESAEHTLSTDPV